MPASAAAFQATALSSLVDCLAQVDPLDWARVDRLLRLCPPLPLAPGRPIPPSARQVIIALGETVLRTEQHADRLLPLLLDYLAATVDALWPTITDLPQFLEALINVLGRIASSSAPDADRIVHAIVHFFADAFNALQGGAAPRQMAWVLVGVLRGLGSTFFPWTAKQSRILIKALHSLLAGENMFIYDDVHRVVSAEHTSPPTDVKALILRVLLQVTYQPTDDVHPQEYDKMFALARSMLDDQGRGADPPSTLLGVIHLLSRIGLNHQPVAESSMEILSGMLLGVNDDILDDPRATPDDLEAVMLGLVTGLARISLGHQLHLSSTCEELKAFYLRLPLPEAVAAEVARLIVDLLRETIAGDPEQRFAIAFVSSLGNQVGTTQQSRDMVNRSVELLGSICSSFGDVPIVHDIAVPALVAHTNGPAAAPASLQKIAIQDNPDLAKGIAQTLCRAYAQEAERVVLGVSPLDTSSSILKEYPALLLSLVNHHHRLGTVSAVRSELFALAVRVGAAIQDTIDHKSGSALPRGDTVWLWALLPSLAAILVASKHPLKPGTARQARLVLYLCVLYGIPDLPEPTGFDAFARAAPSISASGHQTPLEAIELEMTSFCDKSTTAPQLQAVKETLSRAIAPALLRYLKPWQLLYVASVYHLEARRAITGGRFRILSYLEDDSNVDAEPETYLLAAMPAIADRIFVDFVEACLAVEIPHMTVVEQSQILLANVLSRSSVARKQAFSYVQNAMVSLRQLLWSPDFVRTLFDLLDDVATSLADDVSRISIGEPLCESISLPDTAGENSKIFQDLSQLCLFWHQIAHAFAPGETIAALQTYLLGAQKVRPSFDRRAGYAMAMQLGATERSLASSQVTYQFKPPGSIKLQTQLPAAQALASNFGSTLELKARHASELAGMQRILNARPKGTAEELLEALEDKIQGELRDCLPTAADDDTTLINEALLRAAALIVAHPREPSKLIRSLCWAPVYAFVAHAMEMAVFCWRWVLSARPELELQVMSQLAAAWNWSIGEGMGLFDRTWQPWDAHALAPERLTRDFSLYNVSAPHQMMLSFFEERFQVIRLRSPDQLRIFANILRQSLSDDSSVGSSLLGFHPKSIGARFQLLIFGLDMISSVLFNEATARRFLEQLYGVALDWFTVPMSTYHPKKKAHLEESLVTVARFFHLISGEGVYAGEGAGKNSPSGSVQAHPELDPTRKLLLLLLAHEIERMTSWNYTDGQGVPEIARNVQPGAKSLSPQVWKAHLATAMEINPALAIQLSIRFPLAGVRNQVEALVRTEPQKFARVPDAVTIMLLEASTPVTGNEPFLRHLATWAPTTMDVCLRLLQRPLRGLAPVVDYVLRSFDRYDPDELIFVIGQLTQAVRFDDTSRLFEYLLRLCTRSDLFAHQMLWAAETVLGYKETEKDTAFLKRIEELRDRIHKGFTSTSSEFYRAELDFFNKFIQISSILKPLEPDTRGARINEELGKIDLTREDLYLPTNPSSKVVAIKTDNGIALKSATRVPILVTFFCKQEAATAEQVFKQGCIFKMNDDLRQDILATQTIFLFERIFKRIGLNVYLAPYRVIGTGRDCGVIEVVPNATSRDSIGHTAEGSLYSHFVAKYGPANSVAFYKARRNFVESLAAYAVLSYILQVKDRHNGNILIQDTGHLVHIDFGFMFETSPGGNIRFESAPFKLTLESLDVMGGDVESEPFKLFSDLAIKAFLAVRQHRSAIVNLIMAWLPSKLPCFRDMDERAMRNLRARFVPDRTEKEAAAFFQDRIRESLGKLTTLWYDQIQAAQQQITYAR